MLVVNLTEFNMFIVYHTDSTQEVARYKSQGWANRKMVKLGKGYSVTNYADYDKNVVKKVMVKNFMTGEMVEQDSNTPHCCDVSSETYWTM